MAFGNGQIKEGSRRHQKIMGCLGPIDLVESKRVNLEILELSQDKTTPKVVLDQLFIMQELALGGITRKGDAYLSHAVQPHYRLPWKQEVQLAVDHERKLAELADDPEKLRELVAKHGMEYSPRLNNRSEKREWRKRNPFRRRKTRLQNWQIEVGPSRTELKRRGELA